METKYHNREQNLKDGEIDQWDLDAIGTMVRRRLGPDELFLEHRPTDFKNGDQALEISGTDILITTNLRILKVQQKKRRPEFWDYRGKDILVEVGNEHRNQKKGWYHLYRKQGIDLLAFEWTGVFPEERAMLLIRNTGDSWFDRIEEVDRQESFPRKTITEHMRGKPGLITFYCVPIHFQSDLVLDSYPTALFPDAVRFAIMSGGGTL